MDEYNSFRRSAVLGAEFKARLKDLLKRPLPEIRGALASFGKNLKTLQAAILKREKKPCRVT